MTLRRRGLIVGLGASVVTIGLLFSVQSWVSAAPAKFRTQADPPVELVVYPSVWTVTSRNSGSNMIALKGLNGFSGTATVTVSGLPSTILDRYPTGAELAAGKGGYYCSSHCIVASNADFPMNLAVTNGQWTSLGTSMLAGAGIEAQTKTVTITASANGQSVSKTFTLKVINDEPVPGPGGFTYAGNANPDVIATVNDASWNSDQYKLTGFTAGTSKTKQIDVKNVSSSSQSVALTSNISGSGLADVSSSFTGSLGSTNLTLAANETKAVDVTLTPSTSTPNGTYEVILGITQADGSNRAGVGFVAQVTGSTAGSSSSGSSGSSGSTDSSSPPAASTPSASNSTSTPATDSSSTPPSNAAAEAQAVIDAAKQSTDTKAKTSARAQFKLSTNGLVFESKQGADPANGSLSVLASGEQGSSVRYAITDNVDWLNAVGDPVTLKPGESHAHEIDVTIPPDMASGVHHATITVTDDEDPKKTEKITVTLIVSLYQFSLPMISTETRFVSRLRPGFKYYWSTILGNEGTADAVAGILVPIAPHYQIHSVEALGDGVEVVAQEDSVVAITARLKPGESRGLVIGFVIPPERLIWGKPTNEGQIIRPGDQLPMPEPFVFSTVSSAKWDELKSSLGPDQLPAAAFAESLRATGAELTQFRTVPAGVQQQSLKELAAKHPALANGLASALVTSTLRDTMFGTGKRVGRTEQLRRLFGSVPPLAPRAYAADGSWYNGAAQAVTDTAQLGLQTASNVVSGFADGRQATYFEAALYGAAEEVFMLDLLGAPGSNLSPSGDVQAAAAIGKWGAFAESAVASGGVKAGLAGAELLGTVGVGFAKESQKEAVETLAGAYLGEISDQSHLLSTRRNGGLDSLQISADGSSVIATAQGADGNWVDMSPLGSGITRSVNGQVHYGDRMDPTLARQLYPDLNGVSPAVTASWDPNHLSSTPAEGPINSTDPITYHIDFENLKQATADALRVAITLPIDEDFDLASTQFLSTSHADHVKTTIDEAKRELRWEFTGISLPPNVTPPEGEGYAEFSIRPKTDVASGTELVAKASIVFDFNPAIETNTTTHLLDTVAPIPTIASAKATGNRIEVTWSATDPEPGSGIAEVRLVASPTDLGEGTEQIVTDTPARLKVKGGKQYLVRALAIDKAGNVSPITEPVTVYVPRPWWIYVLVALLAAAGLWKLVQHLRLRSSLSKSR